MPTGTAALRVAESLRFDPGDSRTIEELASTVDASARTVERGFLAETGMTFRQWRIANRMEAATVLLRSPANIGAVARRVGYSDAGAFRRVFKSRLGMTPSEYVDRFRVAP
jgi:transcriptional regulator GlxA family with amidase domain